MSSLRGLAPVGRQRPVRWALLGGVLGGLVALVLAAPAAWMAGALADATGQRFLLADARGSLWTGSAVLVLTGGAGSRSASALPGRLHWNLGWSGAALTLRARQDCCINGELRLRVSPGWGRVKLELQTPADGPAAAPGQPRLAAAIGQWPAAWLVGLGTPWNTVVPTGTLQLNSPGFTLEQVQGRWRFDGRADLEMGNIGSRLTALDVLGSYRLSVVGDAAQGQPTRLQLSTSSGALQLQGSGEWSVLGPAQRLRFTGAASAAPGSEAALGGLLNIIGRRQGAQSIITIG